MAAITVSRIPECVKRGPTAFRYDEELEPIGRRVSIAVMGALKINGTRRSCTSLKTAS